jgi:hypothetical protein
MLSFHLREPFNSFQSKMTFALPAVLANGVPRSLFAWALKELHSDWDNLMQFARVTTKAVRIARFSF